MRTASPGSGCQMPLGEVGQPALARRTKCPNGLAGRTRRGQPFTRRVRSTAAGLVRQLQRLGSNLFLVTGHCRRSHAPACSRTGQSLQEGWHAATTPEWLGWIAEGTRPVAADDVTFAREMMSTRARRLTADDGDRQCPEDSNAATGTMTVHRAPPRSQTLNAGAVGMWTPAQCGNATQGLSPAAPRDPMPRAPTGGGVYAPQPKGQPALCKVSVRRRALKRIKHPLSRHLHICV